MRARALGALVVAALALLAPAAPGIAQTRDRVVALAQRAAGGDADALARLRAVRSVDGRPSAVGRALDTRSPAELRARLKALATPAPATAVAGDATMARAQAQRILADERFAPEAPPRPLRALFDALGDLLERLAAGLGGFVPGGEPAGWVLLVIVAALVAAAAATSLRRRGSVRTAGARAAPGGGPSAADLERAAIAAERAGDHSAAVRLRFRAGLLRLDASGAVPAGPDATSGAVARALGDERFDDLAGTFDAVAYGGHEGEAGDTALARDRWPAIVRDAERAAAGGGPREAP